MISMSELEVRELKKMMVGKDKIVKKIEAAKIKLKDIKLHISVDVGMSVAKEELANETMSTIKKLLAQLTQFAVEEV